MRFLALQGDGAASALPEAHPARGDVALPESVRGGRVSPHQADVCAWRTSLPSDRAFQGVGRSSRLRGDIYGEFAARRSFASPCFSAGLRADVPPLWLGDTWWGAVLRAARGARGRGPWTPHLQGAVQVWCVTSTVTPPLLLSEVLCFQADSVHFRVLSSAVSHAGHRLPRPGGSSPTGQVSEGGGRSRQPAGLPG